MTIRNFASLLAPTSIAMIGASPSSGSIGRIVTANLTSAGFQGPIWLVNPRHTTIDGHTCVASVAELHGVPDLAVVATPPATIPRLIAELGAKGTKAAVVISAGVTPDLRQTMLEAARPHLLRIQGPNCLGLMVPQIGLNASFCHRMPHTGDLAFVSQSGALITAVVDWASRRDIGFSHVVSVGDMADVDFGDLLDYLAGDGKTRAILLYMEHLTHAPKFMSAARRAARAKPVVVLKSGRHAAGAKAAMSHTGALAGSDAAYDAAFRRAGLLRVMELEDLFEAAEILARMPRLDGERLVILTNGGGAGVLAADRLSDLDGMLADVSGSTRAALDALLPPAWSHGNPVDMIGDADAARYARALEILMQSDAADAVLVMNCPTALASSTDIARAVIDVRERRRGEGKALKPLLTNWLGDGAAEEGRQLFAAARIPSFETPAAAIDGFMQLVRYARAQDALMQTPPVLPGDITCDHAAAQSAIDGAAARGQAMLSEVEAKSLLAAYGIPVVATMVAKSVEDVAPVAQALLADHAAVVIKILSDDITHKSDVGGVRLNLTSAEEAREAARSMHARITSAMPAARIAGFTVQPMIRRPRAHELIVGMTDDPTFGPMLMFGTGGTGVEVIRDTAHALPPLDLKLARDMMRATRVHRLLEGYRDRPKADLDAIAATLVRLSALVIAHTEIREIDINPLLADDKGVVALDARVRIGTATERPRWPLSIRAYPAAWQREVSLAGLGAIQLRPIRPEDEHLYARFIERLTPDDMRMRFFIARPHASHAQIARFTQIDYAREMAFVAIGEANGDILGVARLVADPDYHRAEYAIIVASDLKGHGLGWTLMQHLIAYARAEGLSELFGEVLAENETMLKMSRELGFKIAAVPDDANLMRVSLDLKA